jgi:hypothetical protein
MRKLGMSMAAALLVSASAIADTGWSSGGSYLSLGGTASTWYDLDQAFQAENLNGANFGTFTAGSDTLTVSAELNFSSNEGNVFDDATVWWRLNGTGSFTALTATGPFTEGADLGGGFFSYQAAIGPSPDLVAAAGVGSHTMEFYFERSHTWEGGSYTAYMTHDGTAAVTSLEGVDPQAAPTGDFFTASFEVVPEPGTMALFGLGMAALAVARRRVA